MSKTVKRVAPAALAWLSAPLLMLASTTCAGAQDAFNSVELENDFPRPSYPINPPCPDPFAGAPQLEGATNGTIAGDHFGRAWAIQGVNTAGTVHIDADEYKRQSSLPDGRIMLGESLCDLSTREIAADDEAPPPDFPPLPKRISIPREITEQKAREKEARDNYDNDRPINGPENYVTEGNNSDVRQPLGVWPPVGPHPAYVSRDEVKEMSRINAEAGDNPDFTARLAALSLKMQHQARPKNFFEQTAEMVGGAVKPEPDDWNKMCELKKSLLKVKASKASPAERARLAEKLEQSGNYYDALVERLRCVDILDDGPSRYYLARLYGLMGEKKLAFETLRDAVAKSWSDGDRDLLIQCHILLGDSLFDMAREALRSGNPELNILRLRNASVSYRRAATMDRNNRRATTGLIKVAREAVSVDPSFDNYLFLGGAYLIAGDLDKAHTAYDECAGMSPDNGQLKQAWMIYQLALRRRDQSPRVGGVVTARRRQAESDGETLVSSRKQR